MQQFFIRLLPCRVHLEFGEGLLVFGQILLIQLWEVDGFARILILEH